MGSLNSSVGTERFVEKFAPSQFRMRARYRPNRGGLYEGQLKRKA
jgi:hypothetical protein